MAVDERFDPYAVFAASVQRFPEQPALRIGALQWSYSELEAQAASIGGWCELNTPSGSRVAVHGAKGAIAYAAILGILRSGRSYVPLHPDHPPARWRAIIERSGASACIADPTYAQQIQAEVEIPVCSDPSGASVVPARGGEEAYVMFTSGSTGGPKGVPITRANVAAYLEHVLTEYRFRAGEHFSQLFALTFDLSVHDLFVCWGSGGCLCVPEDDSALRIQSYLEQQRITSWFSVPSLAALLRRMRAIRPGAFPHLRYSFFCGEALPVDLAKAWCEAASGSAVANLYGPTEATIAITAFDVRKMDPASTGTVPLGRAIGGNVARVERADDAVEGELLLSGPQLSAGYLNDPIATKKAFVKAPGDERTWYRTGDIVRLDVEGILHFVGRTDDQVKVLGHRVEPGEVDTLLRARVPDASVLTLPISGSGSTRLVTFIDRNVDTPPLLLDLRKELPAYMVPERIICVDGFPTTAHGKVDRKALIDLAQHG